ncbi:hypothetical protein ZHAS_00008537 [Anopheles sinensis]|uniref:Uncharacterized protein n=1 Tax=Anopheles sinensis TaxID=74873 RepID=A0A084VSY7_ANOSI|nr:hypothetical protein ZHAS_00008537 [Anopheles sinensis]
MNNKHVTADDIKVPVKYRLVLCSAPEKATGYDSILFYSYLFVSAGFRLVFYFATTFFRLPIVGETTFFRAGCE